MKRILLSSVACAICATALSSTGCYRAIGPHSVARDRSQYAASLSDSWKEQTLLNIVKIRYIDPPILWMWETSWPAIRLSRELL